jgi:hypothetical protein
MSARDNKGSGRHMAGRANTQAGRGGMQADRNGPPMQGRYENKRGKPLLKGNLVTDLDRATASGVEVPPLVREVTC